MTTVHHITQAELTRNGMTAAQRSRAVRRGILEPVYLFHDGTWLYRYQREASPAPARIAGKIHGVPSDHRSVSNS